MITCVQNIANTIEALVKSFIFCSVKCRSFVQIYANKRPNDHEVQRIRFGYKHRPISLVLWRVYLQKRFVHKMPLPRSAETQLIRRSAHTFLQAWTLQRNFNGQRLDILLEMQKMQHCASVNCQLNLTRSSSRFWNT